MELTLFDPSFRHDSSELISKIAHRAKPLTLSPLAFFPELLNVFIAIGRHEDVRIPFSLFQPMLSQQLDYFIGQRNITPIRIFDSPLPSGFVILLG